MADTPDQIQLPNQELLSRAIHKFNITVGECDHTGDIGDCEDRAAEHIQEYERLLQEQLQTDKP